MTREVDSIGDLLRQYVKERYPTQIEAAKALHCSQATLSGVMSGSRMPTREILDALGMERHEVWVPKGTVVEGLRKKYTPVRRFPW